MLMNSLPESWNDTISGLLVQMNQEELSLKNVSDRVRTMGEWKAFFKKREDNKKNQKGIKGNCYGCGKAGHYVYDCPYKVLISFSHFLFLFFFCLCYLVQNQGNM